MLAVFRPTTATQRLFCPASPQPYITDPPTTPTPRHHQAGMAPPRLRVVLHDYRPPSAACHVLPAEPLPLDGDDSSSHAVVS